MMTADQERARAIRAKAWPLDAATLDALMPQPWHGYGLLGQIVFFVLTLVGIAAFYMLTKAELLTAALCIALAEYLIRARKWFGTGVEAALWIGGLFAAITALPRTGAPEANLLFAAAAGVAGYRVRNPLFGALAAFFVTQYLEVKADLGTIAALLIALFALIALLRTWSRPSTEWLFIVLVVTMPLAGSGHSDSGWKHVTLVLYTVFAALALAAAIRKRHHALFAGAAAAAAVAALLLFELFDPSEELALAMGGAALLVAAGVTARLLRGRTSGFVVSPAALTPFDDDLESLATIAAQPSSGSSAGNPPDSRSGDGGGFGGGGATADY